MTGYHIKSKNVFSELVSSWPNDRSYVRVAALDMDSHCSLNQLRWVSCHSTRSYIPALEVSFISTGDPDWPVCCPCKSDALSVEWALSEVTSIRINLVAKKASCLI